MQLLANFEEAKKQYVANMALKQLELKNANEKLARRDANGKAELKNSSSEGEEDSNEDESTEDDEMGPLSPNWAASQMLHCLKELASVDVMRQYEDFPVMSFDEVLEKLRKILNTGGLPAIQIARTERFEEEFRNTKGDKEVLNRKGYHGAVLKLTKFLVFKPPLHAHFGQNKKNNQQEAMEEMYHRLKGLNLNLLVDTAAFDFDPGALYWEQ